MDEALLEECGDSRVILAELYAISWRPLRGRVGLEGVGLSVVAFSLTDPQVQLKNRFATEEEYLRYRLSLYP